MDLEISVESSFFVVVNSLVPRLVQKWRGVETGWLTLDMLMLDCEIKGCLNAVRYDEGKCSLDLIIGVN